MKAADKTHAPSTTKLISFFSHTDMNGSIYSFPPIATRDARLLVLGSMPGTASLDAAQYYAHPRNAFWPIMGQLAGAFPELSYASRITALQQAGIAVWDVLAACTREGSLDADIDPESIQTNNFQTFFQKYPLIRHIFFNGTTAEQYFRRRVQPLLNISSMHYQRLPSTSPANASLSYDKKLITWKDAFGQISLNPSPHER